MAGEENVGFVAKAYVLRPLTGVEIQTRFALARVAAVELQDEVFDVQTRKLRTHRRLDVQAGVEPAIGDIALCDAGFGAVSERALRAILRAGVNGQGIRAVNDQRRGHAGFVADFDEKRPPSVLDEFGTRYALRHAHAAFRVDVNVNQAVLVEYVLNRAAGPAGVGFVEGLRQRLFVNRSERRAQIIERLDQSLDVGRQRLQLHRRGSDRLLRGDRNRQEDEREPARGRARRGSEPETFHLLSLSRNRKLS
ncbi:MAG: hypothetical protein JMDDDDMK_03820 [Acidobacteria bacterium]|nr:hypothetical protein [Acidobacteriota bacterium]